jgi:putative redox protein
MKITLNYSEKLHFKASARHFSNIHIDEPESFHGTDLAPSPIEYFLIGTGSCIGNTFIFCLQKHNISFENLKINVDGILKHLGPNKRLRLVQIDIEILIELKEHTPNDKFDLCYQTFQDYCPISNVITQGIPLNVDITKK